MGEYTIDFFGRHQHLGSVHGYSETRFRSNVWKVYTHKLTFCWNCWVYALRMTLFSDWNEISGTTWRLKCTRIFFPDPFSAVYSSNRYGCRPYCLLAFSDNVLFSSKSLLSQDKFRWSPSLAMFQLMHKRRYKPENLKSNRKLHFSWVQVKISIFHGRYRKNKGDFRARVWNSVLLEVALQFYLIIK